MPRFVLIFLIALQLILARAGEIGLIRPGERWQLKTINAGADFTGWTQPEFNDAAWLAWPSGFNNRFAIPGTREATFLQSGANILGHAFRKHFAIADPSYIRNLILRIDYEHGFVAYLNGVEVARRGFPDLEGMPVPLGALAAFHQRQETEVIEIDRAHLRASDNVLAISLHHANEQAQTYCLVAELMANFSRAPQVANPTQTSAIVTWKTAAPSPGRVEYGKTLDSLSTVALPDPALRHEAQLSNLEPGTQYYYRVFTGLDAEAAASDWTAFRTLKPPGQPIRFAVMGDTGQATLPQYELAAQLAHEDIDLWMHTGDVVYPGFASAQVDARHFSIYRDLLKKTPFYSVMGNHDGFGLWEYAAEFIFPKNTAEQSEFYYSFDHGDAHFVAVGTETTVGLNYFKGSTQYAWLENDLATTQRPWKFLFFHHVLRTSALHAIDDYLGDGIRDSYALREMVGGLAARYGAQIIFNGHDHDYERFGLFDGVSSFITGGGGATLYTRQYDEPGSDQFRSRNHYMIVEIDGSQLQTTAIANGGQILDRYYRSIEAPSATLYESRWQTPTVEAFAGADGDGNISGQTFDFAGEYIPTLAGLRANLGRLRVRNDDTFLYVGFEQASIHIDQFIALFIENPAQPGPQEIASLGNGISDPDGEGADGLDALTTLRFQNFRPSIACLLGDELVDTTVRSAPRPTRAWAPGQGVFRLDTALTTVATARLQQFNTSPQEAPQFWEQNADLIEVAIPLAELGNPRAPQTVKIGAIALTAVPDEFAVSIDTAVAGRSLTRGENGISTLEPIVAQLAEDPNAVDDPYRFVGSLAGENRIRLSWLSADGRRYHIQGTADLALPFEDLNLPGLPITATGTASSFEVTVPAGARAMFYRLRVLP